MADFMTKLDARSRFELEQAAEAEAVEILVETDAPPTREQREELSSIGCTLHSSVGNVMSAATPAAHLKDLAALPFVSRIQLSRSMFEE